MMAPAALTEDQERLLQQATRLESREELRTFARENDGLRDPALVTALSGEATKLVRVDIHQARRIADLANHLADELGQPFLQGRSRRARANVLHVRGENDKALSSYEAALALFESLGEDLEAGITRSSALQTLAYVGQHDRSFEWAAAARQIFEAADDTLRLGRLDLNLGTIVYRQERFEEALELMERAYDRLLAVGGPADVAHCLRNLATVHIGLKNFREAEEVYTRAKAYCEKGDLPLLLGEVEYNIAYLYYLRGEFTTAIELYRATRRRCEAAGEVYHQALCDLDEAEIYLELNLIDETLSSTDAAFRRFEQLGMRYEAGKALTYLAIARIRQGKTILGLDIFDQAREIFVGERNQVWPAVIDLYKAVALTREGRRFEAEGLVSSAQRVFEEGALTSKVAACEALRARIALLDGDLGTARRLCKQALDRLVDLDLPALEHQALYILGRIEEDAGNPAAALAAFEASHHELSRRRSSTHADELKIPLLGSNLEVYESLVALLGNDGYVRDPEAIFDYMEIAKARNLVDLLAFRGQALPTRKARSAQVERVRRLREELNWYYRRIDVKEMAQEEPSAEELAKLRRSTRRAEDQLAESLGEMAVADPEFVSLQTASPGGIEEIRSVLPEGTALLEYYAARDTLYACTLNRSGLQVTAVSLASRVREYYRRFNNQLLKYRLGEEHVARFEERILRASREALRDLYQELVEPIEPYLTTSRELVIVPHGFLHWLPFHAFWDGSGYLVDRFAISYAPTATEFHRCATKLTDPAPKNLLLAIPEEAYGEAEALAGTLNDSTVLLGDQATIGALKELGSRCQLIHVTSRANFRSDNPMFSSIELAGGRLNLFDLYGLQLEAELVVLSGFGRSDDTRTDGDEWLGMARGLLYAGSRSVMLPLWNPSTDARTSLLEGFYQALSQEPSRAAALAKAMIELRERFAHPYHWASFALVGFPGALRLDRGADE
jgi:CHAT domain-containing protein